MGNLCVPVNRTAEDRAISAQMDHALDVDRKTTKLLLLGTGNAGKSTFFRQFQMLYGEGISDEERRNYKEQIQTQCIDQMKLLAAGCLFRAQEGHNDVELSPEAVEAYNKLCQIGETRDVPFDQSIVNYILTLWNDPGIKNGFELRAKLCVAESSKHFWDNIERIGKEDFRPVDEDIIFLRAPTNGITQVSFLIEGQMFDIVDVGGQRSERKKWYNVFDNVNSVLWVASLSSYDEVLFEDHSANAMKEQLRVFQETIGNEAFEETAVILFLNKCDLFEEKLRTISLRECFPEYDGDDSYNEALGYIKGQFKQRNDNPNRDIYLHITCATDTDQVDKVFGDVTHQIVHKSLADARIL